MATFIQLQNQIAYDIRTISTASASGLQTQIQAAINAAVAHYERQNFYFNETIFTFSTVVNQEYYSVSDNANIPNLSEIDAVKILVNGSTYKVTKKDFAYLDEIQTNTAYTGDPVFYAYYDQKIRFYPIPQAVRTVTIAGLLKYADLSNDSDTNDFTDEAPELIRQRAIADLKTGMLENDDAKAEMRSLAMMGKPFLSVREEAAYNAIKGETATRAHTRIRPTCF